MRLRVVAVAMLAAATILALSGAPANASSHREAPGITKMPKVDGTDFYVFSSYEPGRSGYVTFLANYVPLQDAYGGPNFFTLDPVAVVVDVDLVPDAIVEMEEVGEARRIFQRNPVGEDGELIGDDRVAESVEVGVVPERIPRDSRRLAVTRGLRGGGDEAGDQGGRECQPRDEPAAVRTGYLHRDPPFPFSKRFVRFTLRHGALSAAVPGVSLQLRCRHPIGFPMMA